MEYLKLSDGGESSSGTAGLAESWYIHSLLTIHLVFGFLCTILLVTTTRTQSISFLNVVCIFAVACQLLLITYALTPITTPH